MSNLGPREKYGIILLGIALIVFGIYMFGIRKLENNYVELCATRDELVAQKQYYDDLKNKNDEMQAEIKQLEADISDVEGSFIPMLNTESLTQYVFSVFEEAGCPYLHTYTTGDTIMPQVLLPDGTMSDSTVMIKSVEVEYCTTDGINIPQYNRTNTVNNPDGTVNEEYLNELIESMVWNGSESRDGYEGFINGLITLSTVDPDCIKINSFGVQSQNGYMILTAKIDFYAANFANRVSEPDTSAPYVSWHGELNVPTDGGFIGFPFVCDNPNSEWYMCTLPLDEATSTDRPFATYYSSSLWQQMVNENGLLGALGVEDGNLPETPDVPVDE